MILDDSSKYKFTPVAGLPDENIACMKSPLMFLIIDLPMDSPACRGDVDNEIKSGEVQGEQLHAGELCFPQG